MYREDDGGDAEYGIVFCQNPYDLVPVLDGPEGEMVQAFLGGAQVKILGEEENGYRITTGLTDGWVEQTHVKIIPIWTEEDE